MINELFKRPHTIRRQLNAPFLEERLRYLSYRAEQQTSRETIYDIASYQLIIIAYLHFEKNDHIYTLKEIKIAAKRWSYHQKRHLKRIFCPTCEIRFVAHAKHWLQFLGRLEIPKQPHLVPQIAEFLDYMRKEQNLSEATIDTYRQRLRQFFSQIKEKPGQFLAYLTPAKLDDIQIRGVNQKAYARHTIFNNVNALRAFLRYAEHQGWCQPGIANSIQAPRLYKHEALPSSPSWKDVQRLLKTTEGSRPSDIRARAVILLLAVYGLRDSEICHLRLDDFDWERETFRLKRSKLGPIQQFPLVQTVGQALITYIKEVRPQHSTYREIFLTRCGPFHPLKSAYDIVSLHWKPLHVTIKHYGPHSLRHACATRLINQGMPLKTIADQLGHRNLDATRIYAKVDLSRLREVADFNLGGLL